MMNKKRPKVTSVSEKFKNGTTHPFSVKTDDDKIYVLKGIHDECTNKALVNELVSARLAELLELPIPPHSIVELTQDVISENTEMSLLNFVPGPCFASVYIKGNPRINPMYLESITNKCDIPGIVLFDQLLLNTDRSNNDGNLYYNPKKKTLMIIDHTNIFGGFQYWTVEDLKQRIKIPPLIIENLNGKLYRYLVPYVYGNSPFDKIEKRINSISNEDISRLFLDIPLEWGISEEEILTMRTFITHQISHYKEILPQLKTVFKQWKGAY
ncbi:HipA family kinase [Enterococcus sp. AZ109]|uniref:HipA family kinase n=1 Tax=Enterococcus sp. AZ109 TaxID=2774634 RepID=UPI003F264BA0